MGASDYANSGGLSPDIVGCERRVRTVCGKGAALPIDDYIAQDRVDMGQLLPTLVEALQWREPSTCCRTAHRASVCSSTRSCMMKLAWATTFTMESTAGTWDTFLNSSENEKIDGGVPTQFGLQATFIRSPSLYGAEIGSVLTTGLPVTNQVPRVASSAGYSLYLSYCAAFR